MVKVAFRALAIAFYSLLGAALVVDGRTDGGKRLPEGFPFLAQIRERRERLQEIGARLAAGSPEAAGPSGRPAASPAPDLVARSGPGPEGLPAQAGSAAALSDGTATVGPADLPSGPSAVRVNRGLP